MSADLHAFLIGVDHYEPPPAGWEGPRYRSLGGCVRDARRMARFVQETLGVPAERVRLLTAPDPPQPDGGDLPTYANLVAGLRWLSEIAQPGGQVLIHYSGHGGRTPTLFPELKTDQTFDEGLVPTDICRPESQYLRDVELAWWLVGMAERGIFVTLVLDCCHAAGALREEEPRKVPDPVARYNEVDSWVRPAISLLAPVAELAERWRRLTSSGTLLSRHDRRRSGWLPRAGSYTMLAACRPHEQAYEYSVAPGQTGGALTHWVLDTLESRGTGLSWRHLHDRVHAKIRSLLEFQTPVLEGEAERQVFSTRSLQLQNAVTVLDVDGSQVLLNTGQAQAVREGARFAVFPPGWSNDDLPEARLAVVEVSVLGGVESWAEVLERHASTSLEPGSLALPLALGTLRRRRTVRLALGPGETPRPEHRRALKRVWRALRVHDSGFLELVRPEQPAERQVVVDTHGNLEIRDASGEPLPHLDPVLTVSDAEAPDRLVARLEHLARHRNVEELANHDTRSPLFGKIRAELGLLPADYDPVDPPVPLETLGRRAEVRAGTWICLTMQNLSEQVLNLTVLNLRPRWGIRQIHPARGDYLVLDPGREEKLPLRASLPAGLATGTDRLKVFATLDATRFRWLELPDLGHPRRQEKGEPPANPLEELMAAMAEALPASRDLEGASHASREWLVIDVEVSVRR